jgi:hypothetical protein
LQTLSQVALDFGGSNALTGASTSRTLMLKELTALLAGTEPSATPDDYKRAIVDDNLLLKPSASTRSKTYAFLRDRYALDPAVPVFRLLRLLWDRDEVGRPLMALLVAVYRDAALRATVPVVLATGPGEHISSPEFGGAIRNAMPGRLTDKTLKSTGENTTSTYRQSGHLVGRSNCARHAVSVTPASATMALLFATLDGAGGHGLLKSDWVRLLDSPGEVVLAEARVAAGRGWLELRHAGGVLEITFHQLFDSLGLRP